MFVEEELISEKNQTPTTRLAWRPTAKNFELLIEENYLGCLIPALTLTETAA